jgi:triacylglycerol lipase
MAQIVLAHGILGFGSLLPTDPLLYFNGIKPLFEDLGHTVICPWVTPLGSLDARAGQLTDQVIAAFPNGPVYLVGHSMGGLDCRRMLATTDSLAKRVPRLITVATPHRGSPVADYLLDPGWFPFASPLQLFTSFFAHDAGALDDLKVHGDLQDNDVPKTTAKVEYVCIGCDASTTNPKSELFKQTADMGGFGAATNDGVVSIKSSSKTGDTSALKWVWPVDHGGAVGWPSGSFSQTKHAVRNAPQDHLDRYRDLVTALLA